MDAKKVAILGLAAAGSYQVLKHAVKCRNALSWGEEKAAREFITEISGDDYASELFTDEEVKNLCESDQLGDRPEFRMLVVRRAIAAIKTAVGPMKKTPAAILVVEREYRKWAEDLGMRPSHTERFRPYVSIGFFVCSAHEQRAAAIERSLAAAANQAAMDRWSLIGWAANWLPTMGSTTC